MENKGFWCEQTGYENVNNGFDDCTYFTCYGKKGTQGGDGGCGGFGSKSGKFTIVGLDEIPRIDILNKAGKSQHKNSSSLFLTNLVLNFSIQKPIQSRCVF